MHRPHNSAQPGADRLSRTSRLLLTLLCLAQLIVILDISAVNVALPNVSKDLSLGRGELAWTITSYSVVFGGLLLLGGRAADLLGRRRVFLTGLVVFTGSSIASGLAGSAAGLFAGRAGQGLGAAMLSPAALSIIMTTFTSGRERASALGAWGAVGGTGAAIGVLLGGALTQLVDWRAIFLINLPVAVAVVAGAVRLIPSDSIPPRWRGLDLRGAALATASVGALVFAASQANSAGWASTQVLGVGVAALAGMAGFVVLELRTAQPLLRVQRLRDRAVGGGFLMMLSGSAVLFGTFLLSSLYLQNVLHTGALQTGLAFLPMAVATGLGAHAGSHLISHRGVRVTLAGAFAVGAIGMLLLSGVHAHGSYLNDVLPGMLVAGLGLGVVLVSVATSVLVGARDDETGMLSGLNTTGHEIGGSMGIAVLVSIATGSLSATDAPAAAAFANGIGDAFLAAGALALAASLTALAVLPSAAKFLPKLKLAPPIAIH